ncbi:MAG: response regulator, partial [Gemmatirosa sp.]|nr:response regulator [Gemmatirosa sp.]
MIHDPVLAHELRTPLHGVLAAAALLLDSGLGAEQRELAETIREAAGALLRLADDSLGTGADATPRDAQADPRVVVDGVRRLLDPVARAKGVAVVVDVDDDVPASVRAADGALRQVLVNLVGNAVKFTAAGRVSVHVHRAGADVRFAVRDAGPGIDAERRAALFRPLADHDASHGGAGLGLAISAALVRRMGGAICVESASGAGSTFWVTLPAGVATREPVCPKEAPAHVQPRGERHDIRVLVLDDDPVGRRVTARMLERLGCRVDVVGRVGDAEEAMRRARYDVVLLDCELPDGDGCGVARWVRRGEGAGPRTRLVALTACPDPATRERCLTAGMDAYLVKPVTLDELAAALAPAPAPVIDVERVEMLARLDADAPGLLARVAAEYAAGASRQLAALEAAVAAGDAAAVARAAHAVRG